MFENAKFFEPLPNPQDNEGKINKSDKDQPNVPLKNLERHFAKQLAPELRQETARRLRETKKLPSDYRETKKFSGEFKNPEIQEILNKIKFDIIGSIFRTKEHQRLRVKVEGLLEKEKQLRQQKIREQYLRQLNEILEKSPLTSEERELYLSEEKAEAMDLEDYLILLKRLSGYFLSHVTRYGIREQKYMYHSAGTDEFQHSFTGVLKDKKLDSFFTNVKEPEDKFLRPFLRDAIQELMQEKPGLRGEDLVQTIFRDFSRGPMEADRDSVHFALNDIAAKYYGGEKGYDIYFYFPAEVIAYNYYHHIRKGGSFDYDEWSGSYDQDNDVAIWNKGQGIPIDAGIACIPRNAMVDKETGSQYKTTNGNPIVDNDGHYVLAENLITSQEFWENYFEQHPEQKPSKIMYYSVDSHFRTYGKKWRLPDEEKTRLEQLFKQKKLLGAEGLPKEYEVYINQEHEEFKNTIREIVRSLEEEPRQE